MTAHNRTPDGPSGLRSRAEKKLQAEPTEPPEAGELTPAEARRLIHELRVHQVELEMQNEELRRAHAELQAARDRYSDLYDFAPVGYLTLSEKGLILEANLTAAALLAMERGRLIGKPLSHFVAAQDADSLHLYRRRVFAAKEPQTCEIRIVREDGTAFYAQLESAVVDDSEGDLTRSRTILSDVTERKRAEEALQRLNEEERRGIGELLHDSVGQQLAGIIFAIGSLEKRLAARSLPEAAEAANAVKLLGDVSNEVRSLARGLYPVDVDKGGLTAALDSLALAVGTGYRIVCRFQSESPVLTEDNNVATQLYRIAQEAVTNAVEHANASEIVIRLGRSDDQIALTIQDDGVGIPADRQRGEGLGLHIMGHRAGIIGATLHIQPGPEGGTIVACSVPWRRAAKGEQEADGEQGAR